MVQDVRFLTKPVLYSARTYVNYCFFSIFLIAHSQPGLPDTPLFSMGEQCFCLRWNNYQSNVVGDLRSLLEQEEFLDVTLACEGRRLKAHRLMLSACSNYFRNLLKENPSEHPIIFLRDVHFWELESIMDFIYNGQVNVMQDQLPGFIRTAEALQIKGLAAVNNNTITPPKMYELKQIQDLLLRQPDTLKDTFTSRLRPPSQPLTNSFLNQEALNQANKLIPPLIHPTKRFRSENLPYMNSNPYKEPVSGSRQSPNNFLSIHRNSPFAKDTSPPNGESQATTHDLSKKETAKVNPEAFEHKSPTSLKRSPKGGSTSPPTDDATGTGMDGAPAGGRLSPSGDDKGDLKPTENSGSSRSGSPEERTEIEEDRSSHDGSIASLDGFKDEWSVSDQSSPMSIGVNEAGLPICKVCGKVFKHQGSLVAHYQVHQQRTKCPVCKKVLSRHYHMKVHLLTVHKVPDSQIESLLRSQNIA